LEVHAVSRAADRELLGATKIYAADLLHAGVPTELIHKIKPSHLLHLAWNTPRGQLWMGQEHLAWVSASLELYQAFADAGGRRAVLAGSCAEYDWSYETLSEAITPSRPTTLYGTAKNSLREMVMMAARATNVSTAWARIFFLYGPYEPRGRLVSDIATALLEDRMVETSHGQQERDFIYVVDAARAIVALVENDVDGTFNIASGKCIPVRRIIQTLGRLAGRPDLLRIGARATTNDEPQRLKADIKRLHDDLGFTPYYELEEGLTATLNWWRTNS
jgi:nucleoside-diphosphate-sugar epimerase